jgi:hypothetical protein
MKMELQIKMAQALIHFMTVTCFTGTRSSSPKHFQLRVWTYQNVSLILAILDNWLLLNIWLDSTMTEFTGHLHLKLRLLT